MDVEDKRVVWQSVKKRITERQRKVQGQEQSIRVEHNSLTERIQVPRLLQYLRKK